MWRAVAHAFGTPAVISVLAVNMQLWPNHPCPRGSFYPRPDCKPLPLLRMHPMCPRACSMYLNAADATGVSSLQCPQPAAGQPSLGHARAPLQPNVESEDVIINSCGSTQAGWVGSLCCALCFPLGLRTIARPFRMLSMWLAAALKLHAVTVLLLPPSSY